MSEGLVLHRASDERSTCQMGAHLSEGGGASGASANQRSEYCRDQLIRAGEELSFEELRAERLKQDKLRRLTEVKQQLSLELEQKKKLLEQRTSRQELSRRPAGQRLPAGCSSVRIRYPGQPGNQEVEPATLSPVQETSVDAASLSAVHHGSCSPEGGREGAGPAAACGGGAQAATSCPPPAGGAQAATSCPPPAGGDERRRLLERSDVTSCPHFHSEPRPLPDMTLPTWMHLGGDMFFIHSKTVDGGSFSVFKGVTEDKCFLIKVDRCPVPWDFHLVVRLRESWSPSGFPLTSCFLFLDGCVTVYTTQPGHMFTDLVQSRPAEVGYRALALIRLTSQLHSCRLLHAGLRPDVLTCCYRGLYLSDCVVPVDWSSSVDLDLLDVSSVQQVPAARSYISLGLLDPSDPPQLVDLVGVAETVHLLLTGRRMVLMKDDRGWTVDGFSGDEPCDLFTRAWRRFFRSVLNPAGRPPASVLLDLEEQLESLLR